jgi:hypothetical protein
MLSTYYCPELIFWYESHQTLTWILSQIACFWILSELHQRDHCQDVLCCMIGHQESGSGYLSSLSAWPIFVSIFKGLNNVVNDEVFGSHLIIRCLLGWSEVIIVVIDWLLGFFLGHATRLCWQFAGSPSRPSMASTAWFTIHGVLNHRYQWLVLYRCTGHLLQSQMGDQVFRLIQ